MNEKETYDLKRFIWLNVFGWILWREEEYPHRDGYSLGDEYGEKCLEADMVDPLSQEGAMEVENEIVKHFGQIEISFVGNTWFSSCESRRARECGETRMIASGLLAQKLFQDGK